MKKLFIWASEYEVMLAFGEDKKEAKANLLNSKTISYLNNNWPNRNGCVNTLNEEFALDYDFKTSIIECGEEYNDFLDALAKSPLIMETDSLILHHANQ